MNEVRHERWADRLSEFLDGSLEPGESAECEAHLAECGACRGVLEELREVIAAANALAPISPPRDLWGGIAAAIQAPIEARAESGQVIALPTAARAPEPRGRMWSTPQLAAAAVAVMAISASLTWWAGPGVGARSATGGAAESAVMMVSAELPGPSEGLANELQTLQEELEPLWNSLDPETLVVLEQNLAVIEQAIDDSRRALAQDPANEFLSEHLDRVVQRKVTYLREAADIARWTS